MANESNYETLHLSGDDARTKVRQLLKHFRSAMMITGSNGSLHSRPMGLQGDSDEFDGVLWFFTDRDCRKVVEIIKNPSVSLLFQSDSDSAYMHLFGTAAVVDDRAKMKELYTPLLRTWFPKGLDDPRMTLIRFEADRGDFWDSPGGMLQVLAAFT
ncbi:MAG TPA: pyridoxamine 5'-phosphate oxidase family protein, partial [Bryobacteraceae bacterium]|nr:pyridoxamine 5'-phosphate oxidase family protein [Bryobacteraceae bacterium]